MQKFNAVTLVPNMPVMYIRYDQEGNLAEPGHFAFFDEDGYPYVFNLGGTSYTRCLSQTTKCKYVMVMTTNDQAVFNSEKLIKNYKLKICNIMQHDISYSLCDTK